MTNADPMRPPPPTEDQPRPTTSRNRPNRARTLTISVARDLDVLGLP